MKGKAVISMIFMIFLNIAAAFAQEDTRRITFGAEWSGSAVFYTAYHLNYFSPDGYRYNQRGVETEPAFNGEVLLHVGYNLKDRWNLALYTGFTGISKIHNAVPVSFRATRMFKSNRHGDRWLAFADAGTGFMHESFYRNDSDVYTREWFAWQNSLFGELILKIINDGRLHVLNSIR